MRCAVLVASMLVGVALSHAQPPAADLERAKQLYGAAEQAMDQARYTDAVRDYGEAYALTKDPALLYKLGHANEKAGACDVALGYYRRYLDEAKPSPEFVALTRERIAACGGSEPAAKPAPPAATPASPAPAPSAPAPAAPADPAAPDPAAPDDPTAPDAAAPIRAKHQGPWLLVGGSIAMLTVGAILAYSAEAAENDVEDLYVGLQGTPPVFDARTRRRYEDLIAEGERYERLSWASFAVAGALAGGAAVWFYLSRDDGEDRPVIAPTVGKDGASVSAFVRW